MNTSNGQSENGKRRWFQVHLSACLLGMFLAFGIFMLEMKLFERWIKMKGTVVEGETLDIYFHDTYFVVAWPHLSIAKGILLVFHWVVCVLLLEFWLRRRLARRRNIP